MASSAAIIIGSKRLNSIIIIREYRPVALCGNFCLDMSALHVILITGVAYIGFRKRSGGHIGKSVGLSRGDLSPTRCNGYPLF